MSSKLREREAVKCAEDLIVELAISSLPVDPIKIARDREIEVRSWAPKKPGISGFLMKQGDSFGIGYATFIDNQGFIHFTVGHELGHYFLPGHVEALFASGSGVHHSSSGFISGDQFEREADLFSASFLMPEKLFRQAQRKSGTGFPAIEQLASLCQTSLTATAIRWAEFSEDPSAIIVSNAGRVDFCCMSQAIRERQGITWIKTGDFIPRQSLTARFQQDPANISAGKRAEGVAMLDDWFEGAPQIEMKEDVVGLGHYGKTLTILFTEQALEEDEEDEEEGYVPSWKRGR